MRFKGQVSLEFLLVFSIFLSLLIISIMALVQLKRRSDAVFFEDLTLLTVDDIAAMVNNVCVLGEWSSKTIDVDLKGYSLDYEDNLLILRYKTGGREYTSSARVICPVDIDSDSFGRRVKVMREEDRVVITQP